MNPKCKKRCKCYSCQKIMPDGKSDCLHCEICDGPEDIPMEFCTEHKPWKSMQEKEDEK